jgi:hypothetical protein
MSDVLGGAVRHKQQVLALANKGDATGKWQLQHTSPNTSKRRAAGEIICRIQRTRKVTMKNAVFWDI